MFRDYCFENGRRYHTYKEGSYWYVLGSLNMLGLTI